jgi:cobalt-precorrin 5A hydrolase
VVNEAPVLFVQETGEPTWWPLNRPLPKGVAYTATLDGVDPGQYEMLLIASDRDLERTHPAHFANAVIYRPKSLVLGIGCDRGTPANLVQRGVVKLLEQQGLALASVKELATIDKKGDEPALLELSESMGWPLQLYPAEQLDVVPGIENPSEVVKRHVGTRAVAEPAALLAAGAAKLLVPKQTYTEEGAGRSMTLAVARVPFAPREATVAPEVEVSRG